MDTLLRLFLDHPLIAASACVILVLIAILPFAGSRFPRLLLRLARSLAQIVGVPFSFWRRTVLDLVSRAGENRQDAGTPLARRLVPVMQSILILGGLLILTAGILSGWRASGIMRETGQMKAALRSELPELERALADVRGNIAELDREWEESRDCHRDESLSALFADALRVSGEKAVLRDYLSKDPQTKEVFLLLADGPAAGRAPEEIAADIRAALPLLGLPPGKEWLFTRYLDNLSKEADVVRGFAGMTDAGVRRVHQPEIESLRAIEAELGPSIDRVRAYLAAPDRGRAFDVAAFAGASWPAVILFCGFVWVVGALIELMGSGVALRRPSRATVNEEGLLKWAE